MMPPSKLRAVIRFKPRPTPPLPDICPVCGGAFYAKPGRETCCGRDAEVVELDPRIDYDDRDFCDAAVGT